MPGERPQTIWRTRLRPNSFGAFALAVGCVAIATAVRFGLGLINPAVVPFATYYPAILLATLYGGVAAGIVSLVVSMVVSWWMFLAPAYAFFPLSNRDVINLLIFTAVGAVIIWTTQMLRRVRARLLEHLAASSERNAIVSYSGDAIIGFSIDGTITSWNASAEQLLGYRADEIIGQPLSKLVPPERADEPQRNFPKSSSGEILKFDTQRMAKSGERIDISITTGPIRDEDGNIVGVSAIFHDNRDRKEREQHLNFVLRELSHRAKNLLTIIQAIARQTARAAASPQDFERRFGERLQALAQSHDILVEREWRGATLNDLIASQLAPFAEVKTRVAAEGPSVMLTPRAAEKIGIALHELATNAIKHGALSNPAGSVNVSWVLEVEGGTPQRLRLEWRERDGPAVSPPSREGFGTVVVTRLVPTQLEGTASLDFHPQGLAWTFTMPMTDVTPA